MNTKNLIDKIVALVDSEHGALDFQSKLESVDPELLSAQLNALDRLAIGAKKIRMTSPIPDNQDSAVLIRQNRRAEILKRMEGAMLSLSRPKTESTRKMEGIAAKFSAKQQQKGYSKLHSELSQTGMVVIRLTRGGATKRPFFNIVVVDSRQRHDGRFIERIGFYNPSATDSSKVLGVVMDRVLFWLNAGATSTPRVEQLLAKITNKDVVEDKNARTIFMKAKAVNRENNVLEKKTFA